MAIVKVIEILAQSPTSWEDATKEALMEVQKTIHNIQTIYIKDFQAVVGEQGEISAYRVNAKVSFLVDSERS